MLNDKPLYDECAEEYIRLKQSQIPDPLTEALTPKQTETTDKWAHFAQVSDETKDKVEKSLGDRNGYGKAIVPLSHQEVPEHPDVAEHLMNHGWKIHNYLDGVAETIKKVGNPEKGIPFQDKTVKASIGKVLKSTNAPDHVKNAFANDPARTTSKTATSDLRVMISTHPHSLGGMSTGTTWSSCMDMVDGCNKHYLSSESEAGTHVAFLVHKDDHGANHGTVPTAPLARIALKPYHEQAPISDTIFRPENRVYGNGGTAFETTVNKWAKDNYPAKPGTEYRKNQESYDDTGNTRFRSLSKEDVHSALDRDARLTNKGYEYDGDVLEHAMSYHRAMPLSSGHYSAYIDNIKGLPLKASHVAELVNHIPKAAEGEDLGRAARIKEDGETSIHYLGEAHGDKFSADHIEQYRKAINPLGKSGFDGSMSLKVLGNPRLPNHISENIAPRHYAKLHPSKLTDKHFDTLLDSAKTENPDDIISAGSNIYSNMENFKDSHLKKLSQLITPKKLTAGVRKIFEHPKASAETKSDLTNKFVNDSGYVGRQTRMVSDSITPEHVANLRHEIDEFGEHHTTATKVGELFQNKNLSPETASAIKDKYVGLHYNDRSTSNSLDKIPTIIGNAFETKDFDKLTNDHIKSNSIGTPCLGDSKFNNRFMDSVEHKIKTAHDTSLEMKAAGKENAPEFEDLGNHTKKLLKLHGSLVFGHQIKHLNPDMSEQKEIDAFDDADAEHQLKRHDFIKGIEKTTPHAPVKDILSNNGTDHHESKIYLQDSLDDVKYDRKENA